MGKIRFNEINYNEGKNFFEIKDLSLNNNFKIIDLKKLKVYYLNDNNKKNEFEINKDLEHFNLTGKSLDSYKFVNNILLSDSDKSFAKTISADSLMPI